MADAGNPEAPRALEAIVVTRSVAEYYDNAPYWPEPSPVKGYGLRPYIAQLWVPGGYAEELENNLYAASINSKDYDAMTAAAGVFGVVARHSTAADSDVVIRGVVGGDVARSIANTLARRGVPLVNALGGMVLRPDLEGFQVDETNSVREDKFREYCRTGEWPATAPAFGGYDPGTVYALPEEHSGGLAIAPGLKTLRDIYTTEHIAYLDEQLRAEQADRDERVARQVQADQAAYRAFWEKVDRRGLE